MSEFKRIDGKTPNGGEYSEIFYFDEDGTPVDESKAVKCAIRECDSNGNLIAETFGFCAACM